MNAPEADAPQEFQFRLPVDAAHCDRAAQGLRVMAQYQYLGRVRHYENIRWWKWMQRGSRQVPPWLAGVVFAASVVALWVGCTNKPARTVYFVLAAILFLEGLALRLLPSRADRIAARLRHRFARYFGNKAAARMRKTRQAAPFEAVYDLRGELLVYSRIEKGQWTLRWHRRLGRFRSRGIALQTPGLLAIFSKPARVVPSLIALTTEDGSMAAAIRALGWTIVDLDPATGEPVTSTAAVATPSTSGSGSGR
jgi:hypothetical protein